MFVFFIKISYIALNVLLLIVAGVRAFLPFYLYYGNPIVRNINYDRQIDLASLWMLVLVPWDIIFAISGIRSILRNDREQIFEVGRLRGGNSAKNTFKLSVFGLVVIWLLEGIGDRFQIRVPYLLKTRMKEYALNAKDKEVVDLIRSRFKCCGYSKSLSWNSETSIDILPSSCCQLDVVVCTTAYAYQKACKYELSEYVDKLNLWLVLANFPFIELFMSLWNCFLTDILPTSNVIYELGDIGEDVIRRRTHDESYGHRTSTPSPSSPIIPIATALDATKDSQTQSGIVLHCHE